LPFAASRKQLLPLAFVPRGLLHAKKQTGNVIVSAAIFGFLYQRIAGFLKRRRRIDDLKNLFIPDMPR